MDEFVRQHPEEALRRKAGLCGSCAHMRVLVSDKGSAFAQCSRGIDDPAYTKYPHLPVSLCGGWEPPAAAAGGGR